MEIQNIPLSKLKISKCNMRYRDPEPDVSDILPGIRLKGLLQPLIVRPEDGRFGVVAGRRRYFSLKAIREEVGEIDDPPCALMELGDDAAAIEASLLENTARRDPSPVREWEHFTRLVKEGRTVDGIAATFGMTPAQVKQRLALGNLIPGIRDAYRAEEIDHETVRHLTLATPGQQRKWLRLFNDPEAYAPRGAQLKQWLFGGQDISTEAALFPLKDYTGEIVEDLFGRESYFADVGLFWALQSRAIAAKRDALLKAGWSAVEVLEIGQHFSQWEHVRCGKKKGGKVFVTVSRKGEVEIHDSWLSKKEAKKLAKAEERKAKGSEKRKCASSGPVMTRALENYVDLHRHLAVRQALIGHPQVAFRLTVAHMVAPSGNWTVKADPQDARTPAIRASIETNEAEAAFAAEEQAVFALLGWTLDDEAFVVRRHTAEVFAHLLTLDEAGVLRIAAFFMAQSLEAGSDVVEEAGTRLAADARATWQPDDAFFDLIRDRATVNALLSDVAGEAVAKGNIMEKAKTQKQIVRDCLAGANGRARIEGWLPGWLEFPVRGVGQGHSPQRTPVDEIEPERMAAE